MSQDEQLILHFPDGDTRPLPASGALVLGSSEERADRVVSGAGIADAHCAIGRVKGGGWAVRDLGSRGGTQVNGKPVTSARLAPGDVLQLGNVEIGVTQPGSAQSAASSTASAGNANAGQGPRVGGFRIERTLGRGSMGQVFLAVQENLERHVALKVLAPRYASDAEFVRQFQSEARAAAALNHPNVVVVYDAGRSDGHPWLSMEFMEEGNLEERVAAEGPLGWPAALAALCDAAAGLVFAEAQGILHRDIKPANLMRNAAGVVKIADLGLAVRSDEDSGQRIFGTPHFMAPEQARGESTDHRADLYALGATAFRLLTGRTPFEGETTRDILRAKLTQDAPAVRTLRAECPPELDRIVARLLRREASERYPTARELADELEALRASSGVAKRSAGPLVAAVVVAAGGLGAWLALGGGASESTSSAGPRPETARTSPNAGALPALDDAPVADGPDDDDGDLQVFELTAELALTNLPQNAETQPEARRDALLALAREYSGSDAAKAATKEAESIDQMLAQRVAAEAERVQLRAKLEADLTRTVAKNERPAAALAALAARLADTPEDEEVLRTVAAELRRGVLERAEARVESRLAEAEDHAAAGRFEEYEALLTELGRTVASDGVPAAARELLADDFARMDALAGRVSALSDAVDDRRREWRELRTREDERRIASALRGVDAVEGHLRRGELESAADALAALASTLTFEDRRDEIARLGASARMGRTALEALSSAFGSDGWRRRSIADPGSGQTGLEVVGADSDALIVRAGGGTHRIAWGAFLARTETVEQLFRGRLQRNYEPDEQMSIAALARNAAALEASALLANTWTGDADHLVAELDAVFARAREWAQDTSFSDALAREQQAAGFVASGLRDAQSRSWPAAVATIEHALAEYDDTLVINLLSNGNAWREPSGAAPVGETR